MLSSLQDKAASVLKNTQADTEAAIDVVLIQTFLSTILSFIRGCSSQSTAEERIREGGPVAMHTALQVVKKTTNLRGKERRQKAAELVEQGKKLTTEEMNSLLNDAKDLPTPKAPIGIWPVLLLLSLLLCSSSSAQEPKGIWPVDIEQNRRLDALEASAGKTEETLRSVLVYLEQLKPESAKDKQAILDYSNRVKGMLSSPQKNLPLNHAPAYQLVNGVRHHTSDQHLIEHGYTAEQIKGLTPDQKDALHGAAHAGVFAVQQVQPQYQQVCNGRSCRRVRLR